jgi:phosphoenolpyruvate phosphomutase
MSMQNKARALRELFQSKPILRIVGAHDGLGAKLIEQADFDGVWASGFEISTSHTVPDANILTMTELLGAASAMNHATALPVVCDCDTGFGNALNAMHMVKRYEAAGMAAVVIEDKLFPKVNSFVPGRQELAPVEEFMGKIEAAKNAQKSGDFMVFARTEALIAGWGMEEAVRRAYAYAEAGADGIVIHSKAATPDEIFTFAERWSAKLPLVAIPTTYSQVTEAQLAARGFKMVIYANQGLRASVRAVQETLRAIERAGSAAPVEDRIASMREIFRIQGMSDMKRNEERFSVKESIHAVIPAAGDPPRAFRAMLGDKPLCMLEIAGKPLLERQADLLRSCGVTDICVVGGYGSDKIRPDGMTVLHNPDHRTTSHVHSLMLAQEHFGKKCVMVYSDVMFDRQILEHLLKSPHPVTIGIDRAYQTLPYREKKLDLVSVESAPKTGGARSLHLNQFKPVRRAGRSLAKGQATHEFAGVAFFQEEGIALLSRAWEEARAKFKGRPFYESPSVESADLMDFLQYLIDSEHPVHGMEVEHGWSEIHSLDDYERVNAHLKDAALPGR